MHWVSDSLPPRALHCPYCDCTEKFPHAKSYRHGADTLPMFKCPRCESLVYDLTGIAAPIVSASDVMTPPAERAARYVVEAGFSSYYVTSCVLAAVPELSAEELPNHLFVDVGGGMGFGSFLARSVLGIETLTVEPSYTGGLAREILGLDVHRAYFEDLPPEVMARLSTKTCLLHLNSVVEHLLDPAAVLASIIAKVSVARLAIIVPDGAALDFNGPFTAALPFLAPRDHRHLPTARGVELLLERLGFPFQAAYKSAGLLIGVGARQNLAAPSDRSVKFAESLLLEHMLRHPHPQVAAGGASRLVSHAVLKSDANLMAVLRSKLAYHDRVNELLTALLEDDWDIIPYHLGPTCYWLAYDAWAAGQAGRAVDLLRLTEAFADKMAIVHVDMAMVPLEFKWAGLLLRAAIAKGLQQPSEAIKALRQVLVSKSDPQHGARQHYLDQAEADLRALAP